MKRKLNCILLVDDDKITNFVSRRIISQLDCAEKVVEARNGIEALEFLNRYTSEGFEKPDLIFLDINMPGMNGWEFLEEYNKLDPEQHGTRVIVMLTTSLNPDDRDRASNIPAIDEFKNKPLSKESVQEILQLHFAERM